MPVRSQIELPIFTYCAFTPSRLPAPLPTRPSTARSRPPHRRSWRPPRVSRDRLHSRLIPFTTRRGSIPLLALPRAIWTPSRESRRAFPTLSTDSRGPQLRPSDARLRPQAGRMAPGGASAQPVGVHLQRFQVGTVNPVCEVEVDRRRSTPSSPAPSNPAPRGTQVRSS